MRLIASTLRAVARATQSLLAPLAKSKSSEQNGARVCDGYMTRFDGEDFCSACPPEDWEPFTFDGQTYYIQPLDGADND